MSWKSETGISKTTYNTVLDRDRQCVLCGLNYPLQCAHVVPRSRGGRGIETNLVMLCFRCHNQYDFTTNRQQMRQRIVDYLVDLYGEWEESDQIYHK